MIRMTLWIFTNMTDAAVGVIRPSGPHLNARRASSDRGDDALDQAAGLFEAMRSTRRWIGAGVRPHAIEKMRPRALPALLAALPLRLGGLSFNDLARVERADALDVVAGDREGEQEGQLRQAEDPEELLLNVDEASLSIAFTPSTTLRRRYDLRQALVPGVSFWRKGRSAALTLMIPSQHFVPTGSSTSGAFLERRIVKGS